MTIQGRQCGERSPVYCCIHLIACAGHISSEPHCPCLSIRSEYMQALSPGKLVAVYNFAYIGATACPQVTHTHHHQWPMLPWPTASYESVSQQNVCKHMITTPLATRACQQSRHAVLAETDMMAAQVVASQADLAQPSRLCSLMWCACQSHCHTYNYFACKTERSQPAKACKGSN